MKKTFLFFIFLFLTININNVIAIQFSPGYINYELEINQKECKNIMINSDSPILSISDRWAENKSQLKQPGLYTKTSDYHGLSVDYSKEIKSRDKQFEVCISGEYSGEYYGMIILQEEQVGNAIMQGGVWINVSVNGDNSKPESETKNQLLEQNTNEKISGSGITGAVIGAFQRNILSAVIIFVLILIILYLLVNNKRKKQIEFGDFNI